MALPTGQISLSQVNTELGRSSTAAISMNDSGLRSLFGKSSGAISMNDGRGKSASFGLVIASNMSNVDLRTLAINNGWNQSSALNVTINSGVVISSASTATPALTISGSFPGGLAVTNNGTIVGRGGKGGGGLWRFTSTCAITTQTTVIAGGSGGTALSVSTGVTLTNNGTIGGGGGGGGHGQSAEQFISPAGGSSCAGAPIASLAVSMPGSGGGGAGYGSTGAVNYVKQGANTASGGYITSGTCTGAGQQSNGYIGSDGGATTGGAGGAAQLGSATCCNTKGGSGGAGGGLGASGSSGATRSGGSCSAPYVMWNQSAGGAGGAAVSGNSNITWAATGTRLGAIA